MLVQQLCALVLVQQHAWSEIAEEYQHQIKTNYPRSTSQLWYQLYVVKNRQFSQRMIERAEKCGYKALVLTVDACIVGNRECDIHNKFSLPDGIHAENLMDNDTNDLDENGCISLDYPALSWKRY